LAHDLGGEDSKPATLIAVENRDQREVVNVGAAPFRTIRS
jgi:hypothetical protein